MGFDLQEALQDEAILTTQLSEDDVGAIFEAYRQREWMKVYDGWRYEKIMTEQDDESWS